MKVPQWRAREWHSADIFFDSTGRISLGMTALDDTFDRPKGQDGWEKPFSKAEMKAARRATRDQEGILREVLALVGKLARSLPFAEDILAAYHCVRDPATPRRVRFILLAALAYFVLPIDAVPDYIPMLGFTDDAAVLSTAIAAVRNALKPEHREKARETLADL
jgi:uncharacterized membrane protein YkvA (DUF1232 family)